MGNRRQNDLRLAAAAGAKQAHQAKMQAKKAMRLGLEPTTFLGSSLPLQFSSIGVGRGLAGSDGRFDIDRRGNGGLLWEAEEFDLDTGGPCSFRVQVANGAGRRLGSCVSSFVLGKWDWHVYGDHDGELENEIDEWLEEGSDLGSAALAISQAEAALVRAGWTVADFKQELTG